MATPPATAGPTTGCERAIGLLPGDADLYQFGALCLFAQGKYKDTAATLYEVLTAAPAWDWDTLTSFYPRVQTYTTQLRALERYVRANPKDAAGHFILAYQYLVLEDLNATVGQLREVVKIEPRDQVSSAFLEALEAAGRGIEAALPNDSSPQK